MADKESTRLYNQAYYQAHRAYIRECQRRRYAEDAAFKAAMLERRRRYHVANRERENARTNEYNITHRAALRLQQRTRRLKHIARIRIRERAHTLARRAMARGAFVEHIDPVFVFARDGGDRKSVV